MMRLSPADGDREAERFAAANNLHREDVQGIYVTDWITGEILVQTRFGIRHSYMEPANEAAGE